MRIGGYSFDNVKELHDNNILTKKKIEYLEKKVI